jgi:1-deoxy-D-xylulose-5-phosphate reductoisomerase
MMKKRILILGATGSIGKSTLEVLKNLNSHGHDYRVAGLSCRAKTDELWCLAKEWNVRNLAVSRLQSAREEISFDGPEAVLRLIDQTDCDIVVNGIAGSAGLLPSMRALERGFDLALANKETIVMAAPLAFEAAKKSGARILPVDSEHSAVFHLLEKRPVERIKRIILTASGGAFRDTPLEDFSQLMLEDALKHPTWDMGAKITIDSATMANKGLEIIEANRLFDLPADNIDVLIHPQSTIHSFVETIEGSLYAQLSAPDMRIPIQNALTYPELCESPFGRLDFDKGLHLDLQRPDTKRYPLLPLAYETARRGGAYPIVYNGANETAVAAFIEGKISFPDIAILVKEVLSEADFDDPKDLDEVLAVHRRSETIAQRVLTKIAEKPEKNG